MDLYRLGELQGTEDINDKMYPWGNDPNSKTIADVLDHRKLGYVYEK
jgi:hypothetical protein